MTDKRINTTHSRQFSLNLLRTFDTAARLNSFKLAANELFITPSAVSQQIKELESNLGIQLFERYSQGIKLSDAGQYYWQEISPALVSIARSTDAVRIKYNYKVLRVSVIPPIANRVIFPNLNHFHETCPDIKLILEISQSNVDLLRSPVDLTIRFDEPPWDGCDHQKLLDIVIQPVFSSKVNKSYSLSENPKNIVLAPLIHMSSTPDAWRDFFVMAGLGQSLTEEKLHVNDYQAAIEAVLSYGVALTLYPLEKSYVETHQLIALPQLSSPHGAIYAVTKLGRLQEEPIHRFITWLDQQLKSLS